MRTRRISNGGAKAALAVLALARAVLAGAPAVESASVPVAGLRAGGARLAAARSLLRAGEVERALREAVRARESAPAAPEVEVLLGEICFRRADFETARNHFRRALEIDPSSGRAYLGLGRIDQVQYRRASAQRNFARAYALTPNDPDVVWAYAGAAANQRDEIELLKRYLNVGAGEPRPRLEAALGRLQVYEKLGARSLAALDGPYTHYRVSTTPWRPDPAWTAGLLLKASVNECKPLRLVFDTGASGIYLSAKAAAKLGLENLTEAAIGGLAGAGLVKGRLGLARTVQIDGLRFRNCLVHVTEEPVAHYADGVIGVDLFERFLLRWDSRSNTLDLQPYAEAPESGSQQRPWNAWERTVPAGMERFAPLTQIGHMALLPAKVNGVVAGYFLVDTGAAYTSLSEGAARLAAPLARTDCLPLSAAGREIAASSLTGSLQFQLAGHEFTDSGVAAFDFRPISNLYGVEISGLIGYRLLSRAAVTINYRDGLIDIDRSR